MVLGARPRLTRPVWDPGNQLYPKTDSRLRGQAGVPDIDVNRRFIRGRLYESVQHRFRLLAQAVQLPHHRARQGASHYFGSLSNWNLRCLSRLRPRVPVRLVADEDARVHASYWLGAKAGHHHSRPQSGLRPVPGASRSLNLRFRSVERSCCFLSGKRKSRSFN